MSDLITAKQVRKLNFKPFGCVLFKVNTRLQINGLGSQNTDDLVQKVYIHWLKTISITLICESIFNI